jgi:hypothetical protein
MSGAPQVSPFNSFYMSLLKAWQKIDSVEYVAIENALNQPCHTAETRVFSHHSLVTILPLR